MAFRPFHNMQIHPPPVISAVSPRIPFTTDLGTSSFPGQHKISHCGIDKGIFPAGQSFPAQILERGFQPHSA